MKYRLLLLTCTAASIHAGCAQALSPVRPSAPPEPSYLLNTHTVPSDRTQITGTIGSAVALMVRDTHTQSTLPIYKYQGEYWVAGTPGHGYELWLTSRVSPRRVLATTSVDGVNVVSGETAALIGRGYVLSPYSTSTIAGWRKSDREVAAFNFAAPSASYAAQTGRPANVGVIGVAVFPELVPPVHHTRPAPVNGKISDSAGSTRGNSSIEPSSMPSAASKDHASSSAPAPAPTHAPAPAPAPAQESIANPALRAQESKRAAPVSPMLAPGLGTQHGERVLSYAPTVAFKRESDSPTEVITLRYDTVDNLVARGVLRWQRALPQPVLSPQAFPATTERGFVADPPRQ